MNKTKFNLKNVIAVAIVLVSISLLSSCKKDSEPDLITLSTTKKALYSQDEFQIDATSKGKITYLSEDDYVAEVTETGLVTANYVGKTNIKITNGEDSKKVEISVVPKSYLYPEPDVYFGESKQSVINKLGKSYVESDNIIGYSDYSYSAPKIMFSFDSSDKLESYYIMVKSAYSSELAEFLLERYKIISNKGGDYMFMNSLTTSGATKIVNLSLYNLSYWMVTYIPNTTKSSQLKSSNKIVDANKFDAILEKI